jgi:hypothetical protein
MYRDDYVNDFMNDGQEEHDRSNKKIFEDLKKEDKGFYSWNVKIPGSVKPIKVEAYSSGDTGCRIRDAITGDRYQTYKVGSKYEDLFFKIRLASQNFAGRDPPTLFYSSPEQYEKHTKESVGSKIKEKWFVKKLAADASLRKEMEKNEERTRNFTIVA